MEPSLSIAARTALVSGLVTLTMAVLTVIFHGAIRWRSARLETQIRGLAGSFALHLTGRVPYASLRQLSNEVPGEAFWGAVQRFADNIGGDEWLWVSRQLCDVAHLDVERARLRRGSTWRREVAARRLGMIDDPRGREALLEALERGRGPVRLRAELSLARLQDPHGLRWLLRHPGMVDDVAPSIVLAILKRFGPAYTSDIQLVVEAPAARGRLAIAAAEVLGFWKAAAARVPLERMLSFGGLEERIAAARALGNLGEREAADALVKAIDDPAWQVRAQAARSLGRIGSTAAVPRLERVTTDMAWWVRRNACYALTELESPGEVALRRVAESSSDRYAREMAVEALQALEWELQSPGGIGRVG
jgi:HEAT repeat protein